jgi:2-keto-4-pentenoate hydratase/2-oxohepta-3-ene-1,7-dioic acid hydratase in catechol pathway
MTAAGGGTIRGMTTRPTCILAVGRNYAEHAAEMGAIPQEHPIIFLKNPASVIGHGETIVIPSICREHGPQVDWEGELAVVIDRDCRDVPRDAALSFVRGYACANDVSARWWQKNGSGGQYSRGKSFDTFCPLSAVVPASQVGDPQRLMLRTRVNGVTMQEASTASMLFPVDFLISELSRGLTLAAGTVLLTGTPSGVGSARKPPVFLKHGDVVEVEIERVGLLRNPVIEA